MRVLGIDVTPSRLRQWVTWLAPAVQPFFLTARHADEIRAKSGTRESEMTGELRDTYQLWGVSRSRTHRPRLG